MTHTKESLCKDLVVTSRYFDIQNPGHNCNIKELDLDPYVPWNIYELCNTEVLYFIHTNFTGTVVDWNEVMAIDHDF
jgi:hypothetical protein